MATSAKYRFADELKRRIPHVPLLAVLAFATGLAAGVCAAALKGCISWISHLLAGRLPSVWPDWMLLFLPVCGIVLTGLFVRRILRHDITHGVSRIIARLRRHDYHMRPSSVWGTFIASSLTLGFGGSAGAEAPIAYIGAGVGSNIARIFGLSPRDMKILLGCGAAAGIAGIFKAPVGGFLFTLEVLRLELTTLSVIGVLTASITAATAAYILSDFTPDIVFTPLYSFDPRMSGWFLLLGIFIGIYALYYSAMTRRMRNVYDSISRPWLRNLAGGLILALALIMFPALYGEGYGVITSLLAGDADTLLRGSVLRKFVNLDPLSSLLIASTAIVLIKTFAASATNCSGGVAGDFAPTLFAGAVAGYLFALIANSWFGASLPPEQMAYAGMAGMMAGAVRAPVMALFLTAEMTGQLQFFFPLLIVSTMSFGVVRIRQFTGLLKQ